MAELNLKQIIDRLNTEFTGETCKLVFWYDDKAEFEEDIDSVELDNAKVYKLKNHILEVSGIGLLRLSTNGSGEKEKVLKAMGIE